MVTDKPPGVLESFGEGLFICMELWTTGTYFMGPRVREQAHSFRGFREKGKASTLFDFLKSIWLLGRGGGGGCCPKELPPPPCKK